MDIRELDINEAIDTVNQYYLMRDTENKPEYIYDYNVDGTLLKTPEAFWPQFIIKTAQILREGYEDIRISIDDYNIVEHPSLSSICVTELRNYLGVNIDPQEYTSLESIRLSNLRGYLGVNIQSLEGYLQIKYHPEFYKEYIEHISEVDPQISFAKVKAQIIGRIILNKSIDTVNQYYLTHDAKSKPENIYEYELNGSQLLRSSETFWPRFISGAAQIIQDGYDDIRISMEGHNCVEHPSLASVCLSELKDHLAVNINSFDIYSKIKDHAQFYNRYIENVTIFDPQTIFTTIKVAIIGRELFDNKPISQEWSLCIEKLVAESSVFKKLYNNITSSHGLFYGKIEVELIKKEGSIPSSKLKPLYNDYSQAFRLILDFWESGDSDFSITLCQNIQLIYPFFFYAILFQCQDLRNQIRKFIGQTTLFMISDPLNFFKEGQQQLAQNIDIQETIDKAFNLVHTKYKVNKAIHEILTSDIEKSLFANENKPKTGIDVHSEKNKMIDIFSAAGIEYIPSAASIDHLVGLRTLFLKNINLSHTHLHLKNNSIQTLHLINAAADPNLHTEELPYEFHLDNLGSLRSLYLNDLSIDNLIFILNTDMTLKHFHLSNCSEAPQFFCENDNNYELSPYTPHLKSLSISSMRTDQTGVMLMQYTQLKHITLSKLKDIESEGTTFNLLSNTSLKKIDLDELSLEKIQFLVEENIQLDRLTLQNCRYTPSFFFFDSNFQKAKRFTPPIKQLIYSQMPLFDLELYVATQPILEDLVISDCRANSEDYTSSNPYEVHLKSLKNLKSLTLKNMNLTNIKLLLPERLVVRRLTLSCCDVFDLSFLDSSLVSLITVEYKIEPQVRILRQFFNINKDIFPYVKFEKIK